MALILSWTKGNIRTYTKRLDLAEVSIKNGFSVSILKDKSNVYKNS